jgi:LysR family transcriptional activator of nhaA
MSELNYKHLHYLWMIAKAGGVVRAAQRLHVTPQSISGQVKLLDESLGGGLFRRAGRKLELTDAGRVALSYAEEIFPRGEELKDVLRRRRNAVPESLRVGIADVVPKTIAFHLLDPILRLPAPMRIVCREWRLENLLAEYAMGQLDIVISDVPMPPNLNARGYSHLLGTSSVSFLAAPTLARERGRQFPRSLDGAPLLLPGEDAAVRPRLMQWFAAHRVRPRILGEFDDPALMHQFGQCGRGVFVAPSVLSRELERRQGVVVIGETDQVTERYYAISIDKGATEPAVQALLKAGRESLFKLSPSPPELRAVPSRAGTSRRESRR